MKDQKTPEKSSSFPKIFEPALQWVDKNFPIDTWLPLFFLRMNQIKKEIENIDPDVLWSTGDPWSAHWLGQKMVGKLGLPWVADFRDPWTLGNVNLKERSEWSANLDKKAERKIIEEASVLTFTSRTTEDLYKNYYKLADSQTATVYNCFDLKLYDKPEQDEPLFDDRYLNLLFFGKFRRLSPARPLIEVLAKISQGADGNDIPLRIHSFGNLTEEDTAYAHEKGVLNYFKAHTPIPAEEALSVLPRADVLWLSTDPDRKNIIPAKLWDYLAAEKPILSIAPNPEIREILKETGAGIQINHKETQKVARLLHQCILAKQQGKPLPIPASINKEKIKEYEATQITQKLACIFDDLV